MEKQYFFNNGIPPPLHFPMPNGFQNPTFEMSAEQYPQFESSLTTPIDSQLQTNLQVPIMNHFLKEKLPNLRNSMHINSVLPALPNDPGFTERAAKFSCFGSRSFNGRTSQMDVNRAEFQYRSSGSPLGNVKLARVASSPSLNLAGFQMGIQEIKNSGQPQMEMRSNNANISNSDKKFSTLSGSGGNSNEESSVSVQNPSGEIVMMTPVELNSRKRKGFSRGKATKESEGDDSLSLKRSKMENCNGNKSDVKEKEKPKPPEPPKDYIHVRARRGQATDSHSLAERVRREKISERMKLLQDLVPGCNKVTGKALMLDEIINYVQSLQRQVEFLSMKLATVNPRDINMDSLLSKNINGTIRHQICPVDSSSSVYYRHQGHQNPQIHKSLEPIDTALFRNIGMQLDGFSEGLSQFSAFSEDDLQSIVQMGFTNNQTPHMKIEL